MGERVSSIFDQTRVNREVSFLTDSYNEAVALFREAADWMEHNGIDELDDVSLYNDEQGQSLTLIMRMRSPSEEDRDG